MNADELELLKDSVQINRTTLDVLKEVLYSYEYDKETAKRLLSDLESIHRRLSSICRHPALLTTQ